ncbi:hydrogenase nickel incorporation protein HypB [Nitrogeniibacter aestuarii]|uniref:hydrogenase nickel incorporation protein HypB n=1 Tax=Nitrogeniibacter aestuarii TaxID=2815343 RepID=UPI001D1177BC|nr:hydrogenase nickel incorporation protein HypB [Nitrogeniibacter aestuarii]
MCTVCGCGAGEVTIGRKTPQAEPSKAPTMGFKPAATHEHSHDHAHDHPHDHGHGHDHDQVHVSEGAMHFGHGPARAHAPGLSQGEMVRIERDILGKNDSLANVNRKWFDDHGIFALNLVSSPGSGKTTLLCKTIESLKGRMPVAVIEGDQQTEFDADRIRATGAPALQINTGKGCHLDAAMVGQAMPRMDLEDNSLLLIENVGNLVCPAAFDLGEAHKVAILSVTEGEDKPLKYPDMFAAADIMILNKVDLLPYLSFDADKAVEFALRVNPNLKVFRVSATTGEGFDAWLAWIDAGVSAQQAKLSSQVESLKARVADLERRLAGAGEA